MSKVELKYIFESGSRSRAMGTRNTAYNKHTRGFCLLCCISCFVKKEEEQETAELKWKTLN